MSGSTGSGLMTGFMTATTSIVAVKPKLNVATTIAPGRGQREILASLLSAGVNIDEIYSASSARGVLEPKEFIPHMAWEKVASFLADHHGEFVTEWNRAAIRNKRSSLVLNKMPANYRDRIAMFRRAANKDAVKTLAFFIAQGQGEKADGYGLFADKIEHIQETLMLLGEDHWGDGDPNDPNNWFNINFEAETQWGKTICLVMIELMHVLRVYNEGKREVVVIFNVNRNSPAQQTLDDWKSARDIYGDLTFTGHPYSDLCSASETNNRLVASERRERDGAVVFKRNIAQGDEDKEWDDHIRTCLRGGVEYITVFVDEGDEGAATAGSTTKRNGERGGGILDRMLQAGHRISGGRIRIRVVLFSATTYPYQSLRRYKTVRVKITKDGGYSGTVQGKLTPISAASEVAQTWGIDGLDLVRPALYENAIAFENFQTKLESSFKRGVPPTKGLATSMLDGGASLLGMTHAEYCKLCEACITMLFEKIAISEYLPMGPFNGGRGAMLRFGTSRSILPLIRAIAPRLEALNIDVVHHHGTNIGRKSVRDGTLKAKIAAVPTNRNYLVVVLAAARRSDRFPSHTTIFLDFTEEFSTMTAAEQGTLGRASGWHKITSTQSTFCLISDANAQMVRRFREIYDRLGFKVPLKRPANNTIQIDADDIDLVETDRLTINFSNTSARNSEFLQGLRVMIEDRILPYAAVKTVNSKSGPRLQVGDRVRGQKPTLSEVFTPEIVTTLCRGYNNVVSGEISIDTEYVLGWSTKGRGSKNNGSHRGGSDSQHSNQDDSKGKSEFTLEPQADGSLRLHEIYIKLVRPVALFEGENIALLSNFISALPTEKSRHDREMSDEEKDIRADARLGINRHYM